MNILGRSLLIGFTYIGTVVGAGFATGQEILQFFTLYGKMATLTIVISSILFIWLGTKIMVISHEIKAYSYEDMNIHLFGNHLGRWVSLLMLILLLAITTVMLAGAGSVFSEHLNISYQLGLLITMLLAYLVIVRGMSGIKAVNSLVVPIMFFFTIIVFKLAIQSPSGYNFLYLSSDYPSWRIWLSPFMYTAFNLVLSQAVLVPLGATTPDIRTIRLGGLIGGVGITIMLWIGHIALSAHMPGIVQYDIPMGHIIIPLGPWVYIMFIFIIYAEIFTTLIADLYGLSLQLEQRTSMHPRFMVILLLVVCYAVSQIGFRTLLSTLYPLMGLISLVWLVVIMKKRRLGLRS
ncbi:MAG: hypothetical protein WD424_00090 [Paenibacillaceae bacterium]